MKMLGQREASIGFCLGIAITLHLVLVALLASQFFYTIKPTVVGGKSLGTLQSYLYSAPAKVLSVKKTLMPRLLSTSGGLTSMASPIVARKQAATSVNTVADTANPDALSQLLHQAIQEQQHYPDSAIALQRSGIVTVIFTLNPDGSIENLQCVNSSGTVSLDNAALEAVQAAIPFKGVNAYLTSPKSFQLALRFELPT